MLKKIVLLAAALFAVHSSGTQFIAQANAACSDEPAQGVDWHDCRKRNLMLSGNDLKKANLENTNFTSTDMRDSEFDGANFRKSVLFRVAFDNSSAKKANFEKAAAYRVSFKKTVLTEAIFRKSEIQRVDFSGAQLTGADFSKSEAGRTRFDETQMGNNDFTHANIARADFRNAKISGPLIFKGAYFYLTRFEGVDLSMSTGIQQWQLDMACGDDETKIPDGLAKPAAWPCTVE